MIELKDVCFSYASEEMSGSLKNIDLTVKAGEVVLMTGPSGCGKSSVIRLINGLIPHYYEGTLTGEVNVKGKPVSKIPLYETAQFVGTVFQNPRSQFFNVDTTSELAFGCENMGMSVEKILERVHSVVKQFSIKKLMDRSIFDLSGGEKQKIACASVAVSGPDIILMDEPSANLDCEAMEDLRQLIRVWKRQHKTIVIAEHRLSYIWDLADRVVIMEQGMIAKILEGEEKKQIGNTELKQYGLRSLNREDPTSIRLPKSATKKKQSQSEMVLKDFSFAYDGKHPIFSFDRMNIPTGEIVAIIGTNGIGKTTFLHCLCGLQKRCKGDLIWNGNSYKPKERIRKIFMVMQDANHQLFTESVLEEVLISMKQPNEEKARKILESMDLLEYEERHPMSLSGGQKQRVAIACAIASEREILLFDEPTSGLDYKHMMQVGKLLRKLKDMGKTILVVTHDCELIQNCCTKILELNPNKSNLQVE